MQIVVTRLDAHRYSTVVQRDGVQLRVPGYAFMRALPHDLAHFVVEDKLRLNRGFWGSVADGAEFRGMEWIDGRLVDGNLDRVPQRAEAELRQALATVWHRSKAITPSDIANVCDAWRAMQARWDELPVGQALPLEWPSLRTGERRHR